MKRSDYVRMERRMLDQMDESDAAHGSKHVYRVLYLALDIAAHEPEADADVVIAACLLHDIARAEQAKDPSVDHARAGAEKARSLLLEEGRFRTAGARTASARTIRRSAWRPRSCLTRISWTSPALSARRGRCNTARNSGSRCIRWTKRAGSATAREMRPIPL